MAGFRNFDPEKKEDNVGAAAMTTGSALLLGETAVELHSKSAEACISDNKATKRASQ
jgi:hypothetical protein